MTVAAFLGLTVKLSIVLTVLALGLRTTPAEAVSLFRQPGLFLRSLVSMNIVMPLIAVALALSFDLHPAVKLALIVVSISPVPPILPRKQLKAGGSSSYTLGLLVASCALAIFIIPVSVTFIGKIFGRIADVSSASIAAIVFTTVLAPLSVGMFLRRIAPGFAGRIQKPTGIAAMGLLVLAVLPMLFSAFPAIVSLVGNGTLVAIIAFVVAGLVTGHLLGGPESDNRGVLALATSARHPGVAISIAHISNPEIKLATAAVILYLLVSAILAKPYLTWWHGNRTKGIDIPSVKARHA